MLFSPPNEFGKHTFYKLIGFSCAVHSLLLLLIFGTEVWLSMRPQTVLLRKPGRVSLSRRGKKPQGALQGTPKNLGSLGGQEKSQPVEPQQLPKNPDSAEPQKLVAKDVEKTTPTKKESEKKAQPALKSKDLPLKSSVQKSAEKKIPAEKKAATKKESLKPESKKEVNSAEKEVAPPAEKAQKKELAQKEIAHEKEPGKAHKEPEKALKAIEKKDTQTTNDVSSKPEKSSNIHTGTQAVAVQSLLSAQQEELGDATGEEYEEVHAAEAAYSEDSIQQEFGRNFTIPEGFDEYDSFTISFDIKDGKVMNVSPHTKGALVVYTAVKDALLKSTMPKRNRKNIVWVIT